MCITYVQRITNHITIIKTHIGLNTHFSFKIESQFAGTTLLENFLRISLYVTDFAISLCDVEFCQKDGNG